MNQALVIVDMQNDYFPGGRMELVGIEEAAENVSQLLETFRTGVRSVIHMQHLSVNPGATFFLPETEGAEIHKSVAPAKGELVIRKNYPSSFRETGLLAELQKRNVDEIVVCGAMTHMCIDTTVRAAFDLGLNCVVVADGCATTNLTFGDLVIEAAQVHGAFMASLGAVFARVTDMSGVAEVIGEKT